MTPSELGAALSPALAGPRRAVARLCRAASCCRSSRCRRAGCGGAPVGRPTRPPRRGSGVRMDDGPSTEDMVLRYLAVFGPATVVRHACLVVADRPARGGRSTAAAAADLPRRGGSGAVRRRGRARSRTRICRRRSGSCRSTTTCSCRTTTDRASTGSCRGASTSAGKGWSSSMAGSRPHGECGATKSRPS